MCRNSFRVAKEALLNARFAESLNAAGDLAQYLAVMNFGKSQDENCVIR